jgi:hypothetical protein
MSISCACLTARRRSGTPHRRPRYRNSKDMRAGNIGVLCFVGGLVVLWMGCSGGRISDRTCISAHGRATRGEACVHDADCLSGFCDRAKCIGVPGTHGAQCDPLASAARPTDKPPEYPCGPFLCRDGRCQSCRSDAECESYFGMGKCTAQRGPVGQDYAFCTPITIRRPNGDACTKDAECQSLFCDRRICMRSVYIGEHTYGAACVPAPPKPPMEDPHVASDRWQCEGFLCVDQRCRSCQSDVECQQGGASELKCLYFSDWPGKVCVTLEKANRYPPPQVISVPPRVDMDDDYD